MSQKVCIGTKWPIFMVHQKKSRILEKTCQSVQKMLKLFKRVHTDLELCIAVLNSVGPLCISAFKEMLLWQIFLGVGSSSEKLPMI